MLRLRWRELETVSRTSPAEYERRKPGYRRGVLFRVTASDLDSPAVDRDRFLHHRSLDLKGFRLLQRAVHHPFVNDMLWDITGGNVAMISKVQAFGLATVHRMI